jgi:hypothetical protein
MRQTEKETDLSLNNNFVSKTRKWKCHVANEWKWVPSNPIEDFINTSYVISFYGKQNYLRKTNYGRGCISTYVKGRFCKKMNQSMLARN